MPWSSSLLYTRDRAKANDADIHHGMILIEKPFFLHQDLFYLIGFSFIL